MKRKIAALRIAVSLCLCASIFGYAPGASAEEPDINSYIARAPIAGLPAGAYNQWSDAERVAAHKRIGGFCEFLCVDAYGSSSFPNAQAADRAKAEAKVCLGACVANHLPPDYPAMAQLKQQVHTDYAEAKRLGSRLPWPLPQK
jgi:hypothetical protein